MRRRAARAVAVALLLVGSAGVTAGCGGRATTHHKPGTGHQEASGFAGRLLDRKDESGHRYRQVDAAGAPSVKLTVRPDSMDGWNVQLAVQDFRFTPESVGGGALPGRGHAHLYLDDHKIARVYGEWYHLPASAVPKGTHRLTARLYADDHTAWAVDGKPVESTADVTEEGRGSGSGRGGHAHDGSGAPEGGAVDRTVTITVHGNKVQPPPGRVELKKGQRIRLSVTSDRADTLHLHGYDKEVPLPAGRAGTLTLTLDRTGLFEVETHESGLVLTQLVVR
ncbi:hypothetical protein [Streptomyces sp. NPDC046821]|uniref:hypothetical protein n=1 Tax=Streptomyces sp. NPDC046821 TaxID=3154702 RepID=UPI003405BCF3